jgi:hypothetical protein
VAHRFASDMEPVAGPPSEGQPGVRLSTNEQRLRLALQIRDEWLHVGLDTKPADRHSAQAAVAEIYELAAKPVPAFEWVASPAAGRIRTSRDPAGGRGTRLRAAELPACGRDWPAAQCLASLVSDLKHRLDRRARRSHGWPIPADSARGLRILPAEEALRSGWQLSDVLEIAVHQSLRTSLNDCLAAPLRAMLPAPAGGSGALAWHGQHDAYWIGHYDACRATGLITCSREDDHQLGLWAAIARTAGWWWPGDQLCVMSERPAAVYTEPLPDGRHGEVRLHRHDGPAISFGDGSGMHVLHGTPVPEWVMTGIPVARITSEPNAEIRRSAIERIGWDTYIRQAGLTMVAASQDPGNPGSQLRLYDLPAARWGRPSRVLLAVNGTAEADGIRRQYGLPVPTRFDDPVAAAGWTYGLARDQYAQLARRT